MKIKPKISVIVPNYDHELFLPERLDSIFNQTFQNFEVILLDDASTDDSAQILRNYATHPKVSHFIINEKNSGSPFKQWQKGIELAQGEYIWIAESDDSCDINFLQTIQDEISRNVGVYYTQSIDVDENGENLLNRIDYTKEFNPNIWVSDFFMDGTNFIQQYLLSKNVIPNASAVLFKRALIRKEVFTKELLEMRMCGDWLFWITLCAKTNIYFSRKPLNFFRNHKTITRTHDTILKKKQRLLEESQVRNYALKDLELKNDNYTMEMYRKWFTLHTKYDVFKPDFYKIKLPYTSINTYLSEFFKFKIYR